MSLPFTTIQHATDDTAWIAVLSLYATQPTLSVSIGSVTNAAPTVVQAGTDGAGGITDSASAASVAMYVWTFEITGLTAGQAGTYTATQGANTVSGEFGALPNSDETDVEIICITCDGVQGPTSDKGAWGYIRERCEAGAVAICHVDDNGYVDNLRPPNVVGNIRWTASPAVTLATEYAYVCAYAALLGLTESAVQDNADPPINPARYYEDEDRVWCRHNRPIIRVPGDHELRNNAGERTKAGVSLAPSSAQLTAARGAWKKTLGCLQQWANAAHGHAATYDHVGPIEIIGVDRVFGLEPGLVVYDYQAEANSGGIAAHDPTHVTTPVSGRMLSANQTAAIQAKIDSTSPFKLVLMTLGNRWCSSPAVRALVLDDHDLPTSEKEPLHDYTVDSSGDSEWTEIFSDAGGIAGKFTATYRPHVISIHGDVHIPEAHYFHVPARNASQNKISVWSFAPGSVNGSYAYVAPLEVPPIDHSGNAFLWTAPGVSRVAPVDGNDTTIRRYNGCLTARMTGSAGSRSLTINLYDVNASNNSAELLYSETFVENKSTAPAFRRGYC